MASSRLYKIAHHGTTAATAETSTYRPLMNAAREVVLLLLIWINLKAIQGGPKIPVKSLA